MPSNNKGQTLASQCIAANQYDLLKDICLSEKLSKACNQEAVLQRTGGPASCPGEGSTLLDLCKNGLVLYAILKRIDTKEIGPAIKGTEKNLLHCVAKRDQYHALQYLLKHLPSNQVEDMLCQESPKSLNNVLMTAAIHNSGKCLQLLLQHIGPWLELDKDKLSSLDRIMHSKNEFGNNPLGRP